MDARNAVARIYNTQEVDSLMWLYRTDFLNNLKEFEQGKIDTSVLLTSLQQKTKALNPDFLEIFKKGFESSETKLDVELKIVTGTILLNDSNRSDVLFEPNGDEMFLLGNTFPIETGNLINNSTWQHDLDFEDDNGNYRFVNLAFRTQVYMHVSNWQATMIKDLAGLFLFEFILFAFLVILVYYSIRNLLKQKKLSDIKTDFINNITHELKTPLSTLSIATKTLSLQYDENDGRISKSAIDVIDRQSLRLQKLFDQVVDNSVGYKDIELSKETLNATVFLNNILDDYSLALDSEVVLIRNFEASELCITADRFYLGTAIINILNNAVKYGASTIKIDFTVDAESGEGTIAISDNGIGIDKKHHKSIFEKFYRAAEKDTHNYKGLGLGLYYCYQVLKAHHGSISVESKTGLGSTFYLNLPIKGGQL